MGSRSWKKERGERGTGNAARLMRWESQWSVAWIKCSVSVLGVGGAMLAVFEGRPAHGTIDLGEIRGFRHRVLYVQAQEVRGGWTHNGDKGAGCIDLERRFGTWSTSLPPRSSSRQREFVEAKYIVHGLHADLG